MVNMALSQSIGGQLHAYFSDSPLLKFMLQFLVLSLAGLITSQYAQIGQYLDRIFKWFGAQNEVRPELQFSAKEMNTSWQMGLAASSEFKAWLQRVRKLIDEDTMDKKRNWAGLFQLKEFKERTSYYESEDNKKKHTTMFLPNQGAPFQLTEKIWIEFGCMTEDAQGEDAKKTIKQNEYVLKCYVHSKKDRKMLLAFHDDVMKEYHKSLSLTLNSQPHIFEFKGSDDENTRELQWNMFPFSSTRTLEHVWFKQKDKFMAAYTYFLENRKEYERRGDPYTFSCLLYGKPGCGKTSLIKALVNDSLKRGDMAHIFVISFEKIKSGDILARALFDEMVNGHKIPLSSRILIFEDFDANNASKVFRKRKQLFDPKKPPAMKRSSSQSTIGDDNASVAGSTAGGAKKKFKDDDDIKELMKSLSSEGPKESALALSDILTLLDGVNERTGQRCVWTTNTDPSLFDPAFLRPGRMDMLIEFTRCDGAGLKYLIEQYFEQKLTEETVAKLPDDRWTPAEVKQLCKEAMSAEEAALNAIARADLQATLIKQAEEEAEEKEREKARMEWLMEQMKYEEKALKEMDSALGTGAAGITLETPDDE